MTRKINRGVLPDSNRYGRANVSSQTQLFGLILHGKIDSQIIVTRQQRVIVRIFLKSLSLAFICNSSDLIDRLSIIRRLRSTLGFRVIGQRGRLGSIVASLVALGLVTLLVFGIPVGSVVYISRLT